MSENRARIGIGVPSVVLVLLTLSLTVLAVLTLSAGQSDFKLTKRSVESAESYYAAVSESEKALAALDGALVEGEDLDGTAAAYEAEKVDNTYVFSFDAGADRALQMTVAVQDGRAVIVKRTLVSLQEQEDTVLPVYQGEQP